LSGRPVRAFGSKQEGRNRGHLPSIDLMRGPLWTREMRKPMGLTVLAHPQKRLEKPRVHGVVIPGPEPSISLGRYRPNELNVGNDLRRSPIREYELPSLLRPVVSRPLTKTVLLLKVMLTVREVARRGLNESLKGFRSGRHRGRRQSFLGPLGPSVDRRAPHFTPLPRLPNPSPLAPKPPPKSP